MSEPSPILSVHDLRVTYQSGGLLGGEAFVAVHGASFAVAPGQALGLVGESGCGKSSLSKAIVQLHRPSAGKVLFDGADLCRLNGKALRQARRGIQMIFQDPYASLDPRQTAAAIVAEPLKCFGIVSGKRERNERARDLLHQVGLSGDMPDRYPHEFSGGQRQRIGIARALAANPKVLICDEPVSALDVSIQAHVLDLLHTIRQEQGIAMLFIAHDLAVVHQVCDDVLVMEGGHIVESGPCSDVLQQPKHPYTQRLLQAVPPPEPRAARAMLQRFRT